MVKDGFDLIEVNNAKEHVRSLLMKGWVWINGDTEAIQSIECGLYPPGTKYNKDFRIITGANENGKFYAICLGKKNKKFIEHLSVSSVDVRSITAFCTSQNNELLIHTFESADLIEGVEAVLGMIKEIHHPPNW